ncbi:MAG: hypothetical protein J3K34DRAFT_442088 [Monoraphidium minutum]|nr:MAG: hypothetical protein J3K34DRAFT_442088 [Monoraphidium minutum]
MHAVGGERGRQVSQGLGAEQVGVGGRRGRCAAQQRAVGLPQQRKAVAGGRQLVWREGADRVGREHGPLPHPLLARHVVEAREALAQERDRVGRGARPRLGGAEHADDLVHERVGVQPALGERVDQPRLLKVPQGHVPHVAVRRQRRLCHRAARPPALGERPHQERRLARRHAAAAAVEAVVHQPVWRREGALRPGQLAHLVLDEPRQRRALGRLAADQLPHHRAPRRREPRRRVAVVGPARG